MGRHNLSVVDLSCKLVSIRVYDRPKCDFVVLLISADVKLDHGAGADLRLDDAAAAGPQQRRRRRVRPLRLLPAPAWAVPSASATTPTARLSTVHDVTQRLGAVYVR